MASLRQSLAGRAAWLRQPALFLLAGATGAISELLAFSFMHGAGMRVMFASLLSTVVGVVVNYLVSITLVFERGRHRPRTEILLFFLVSGVVVALNQGVFWLLLQVAPSQPTIDKACAILLIAGLSYFAKKHLVFLR